MKVEFTPKTVEAIKQSPSFRRLIQLVLFQAANLAATRKEQ